MFVASCCFFVFFFFKQKPAYEMRISDWSSDVCSSDLIAAAGNVDLRNDDTPIYRLASGQISTEASGYQVGGAAVYTAGHAVRQMTRSAADPQTGATRTIDASAYFTGAADAGDYTDFSYGVGGQSNLAGILVHDTVYAEGGGDISLNAGNDVLGRRDVWQEARLANAPSFDFIGAGDQPWRVGVVGQATNLRVNFQLFTSGIGTLGGGSLSVNAGGDVSNLAMTALTSVTTADVPATGAASATRALWTMGGGDVLVKAGGDIAGGRFDIGRGVAAINAGGDVRRGASVGKDRKSTRLNSSH